MARVSDYLAGIDEVAGVRRNIARLSSVLGSTRKAGGEQVGLENEMQAEQASLALHREPTSITEYLRSVKATEGDVSDGQQTVAGAAVGGLLWREHRVLGVITGGSLGRNLPALFHAGERPYACRNLATTGAAVVGSLVAASQGFGNLGKMIGFGIGAVAGGTAAYFGMKK